MASLFVRKLSKQACFDLPWGFVKRRQGIGLFAGLWLCGLVSIANAQAVPEGEAETEAGPSERDGEARRLYEAGVVAFDDGTFEAALSLFQRAYELSPRPQMLYNTGTAADRPRPNPIPLEDFHASPENPTDAHNASGAHTRSQHPQTPHNNKQQQHPTTKHNTKTTTTTTTKTTTTTNNNKQQQ